MFTLRIDGRTRFDLVEPKEAGALEDSPRNHLWALFINDESRKKMREFSKKAFNKYVVIDPTGMKQFRVRLSDREPKTNSEERGLDEEARIFHQNATLISDLGDGVQASVGLVSAVMSFADRILLIDEPEAFLHPSLARRVGDMFSRTARERHGSLVVATHNADFLMGCLQAAPELRLVRLTYSENQSTARSIEPSEIVTLMNDPLLRSANAMRALFYRGVVVTESDADQAFYEEINVRLLQRERGIEDGLFMNAHHWQTIPRIAEPLRRLGIPAVAIFDFDVIMDKDFRCIWPLLNTGGETIQRLESEMDSIKDLMEKKGRKSCKKSGVSAFDASDKEFINNFIESMSKYEIFFVPVGELECWLASLHVERKKNQWLTRMFTRLGSDPKSKEYVQPDENDIWVFIDKAAAWIKDPKRLGIPG